VRTDNVVVAFLDTWGPSLVLLGAVLAFALMVQKTGRERPTEGRTNAVIYSVPPEPSLELDLALDHATALNAFNLRAQNDPAVRLQSALRFAPTDYQVATREIVQGFRERRVISIDLGQMDRRQAVRLVDFCSGMTAMCSGWIFRLTDNVIVLAPPS